MELEFYGIICLNMMIPNMPETLGYLNKEIRDEMIETYRRQHPQQTFFEVNFKIPFEMNTKDWRGITSVE